MNGFGKSKNGRIVNSEHLDLVRFEFRPWVGRAGLSILLTAAAVTVVMVVTLLSSRSARFGWLGEPFVWLYVATLWAGGAKVFLGSRKTVAEVSRDGIVVRPLHQLRSRNIAWDRLLGTERMIPGDRMIIYFQGPRGMRFVALNLNLVRGRKSFEDLVEGELRQMGFAESFVGRSRYLSRTENRERT